MSAPPPLEEAAAQFADDMTGLLLSTVTDDVSMEATVTEFAEGKRFIVGNQVALGDGHDSISKIASLRGQLFPVSGLAHVELSATWMFQPSSRGNWLKTWKSEFGLWVDNSPFIRLEVDPNKPEGSWLQAHLQIHGESSLLGYLRGLRRDKRTRLSQLHLPLGGFAFRPGIEDFLEFAIDERLLPGKEGWKGTLETTRTDFQRRQLISMVARNPIWAREGLEESERRKAEDSADE